MTRADKISMALGFVFLVCLLSAAVVLAERRKLQDANEQAEAELHDMRLTEEGCRKTDYIPTKYGVRAKWACPDGTVALGAAKE